MIKPKFINLLLLLCLILIGLVNCSNKQANENLLKYSQVGDFENVKIALEEGADVHAKNENGYTALLVTAWGGNTDVAKLLIEKGADVNVKGNDDWTPLMYAAQEGHTEIVKLLIENNADVNVKLPNRDLTALMLSAKKGHIEIVSLLKKAGANDNNSEIEELLKHAAKDPDNIDVFIWASRDGKVADVKNFLENGVDVNNTDRFGRTALWAAVDGGQTEIVKLLIEHGADINATDENGVTVIRRATESGNKEIEDLINRVEAEGNVIPISGISIPKKIKDVSPIYPKLAKQAKIEGIVTLELTTNVYGSVISWKILNGHPLLNSAVIDAIKQWVYEPYIVDGIPQSVKFTVDVTFALKSPKGGK